jgi:hypothetical protein
MGLLFGKRRCWSRRDSRFYVTVLQTRFLGLETDRKENTTFAHKGVFGMDPKEKATPLLCRCPETGPKRNTTCSLSLPSNNPRTDPKENDPAA